MNQQTDRQTLSSRMLHYKS